MAYVRFLKLQCICTNLVILWEKLRAFCACGVETICFGLPRHPHEPHFERNWCASFAVHLKLLLCEVSRKTRIHQNSHLQSHGALPLKIHLSSSFLVKFWCTVHFASFLGQDSLANAGCYRHQWWEMMLLLECYLPCATFWFFYVFLPNLSAGGSLLHADNTAIKEITHQELSNGQMSQRGLAKGWRLWRASLQAKRVTQRRLTELTWTNAVKRP